MTDDTLDLQKIPRDSLERRSVLLLADSSARVRSAVAFIREKYQQRSLFEACSEFAFHDLSDVPRSDWRSLSRV